MDQRETPLPENRRSGSTPLMAAGSPVADAPAARRRRASLASFLLRQADKTSPLVKEHLITVIEFARDASRNWICWLLTGVVLFLVLQSVVLQLAADKESVRIKRRKGVAEQFEVEEDLDSAYRQWKVLQEANPNKFGNFSKFLIESKHKESRLRKKLSALSEESLNRIRNIVVPPAGVKPLYNQEEEYQMIWSYLMPEKQWPYVGSEKYLDSYKNDTRGYYNSLAVFPHNNRTRLHGLVGIWANGTRAWQPEPMPPPIKESPNGVDAELKDGGFYLKLSKALPLDRDVPDQRQSFCFSESYSIENYEDASVVIVFYNEHLSTLLRSVHSVLNSTPPPLLREIVLVDDHSNSTDVRAGGPLDEYIKLLPKTKILRLPERRGIVQARVAGAKIARAPIFVMLDSHIEVGPQWLEPLARRLKESPKSVVFPQIYAIDPETFEHRSDSGIGCFLSFKWMMQERPYFNASSSAAPVSSPSMAGGLFAVKRDWFFDLGGYDDEFKMWGAENVEMAFRYWQCGGRVECMPCSLTYHIYRHGGTGYKSPGAYIQKNRRRTAMLWLDKYYQIADQFIEASGADDVATGVDLGSFEKMKAIKKRFKCKSFEWFLKNIDPGRSSGSKADEYGLMGDLVSKAVLDRLPLADGNSAGSSRSICIDSLQNKAGGTPYGLYSCHHGKGSQGWFEVRKSHQIRNMGQENICIANDITITHCDQPAKDSRWVLVPDKKWLAFAKTQDAINRLDSLAAERLRQGSDSVHRIYEKIGELRTDEEWRTEFDCLSVAAGKDSDTALRLAECSASNSGALWNYSLFLWDDNYKGPPEMMMDGYNPSDYDDEPLEVIQTEEKVDMVAEEQ